MEEKEKLTFQEIVDSYREVIKSLRYCDENERDCSKCGEHNECHLYLRNCISIVMEWIIEYTKINEGYLDENFKSFYKKKIKEINDKKDYFV